MKINFIHITCFKSLLKLFKWMMLLVGVLLISNSGFSQEIDSLGMESLSIQNIKDLEKLKSNFENSHNFEGLKKLQAFQKQIEKKQNPDKTTFSTNNLICDDMEAFCADEEMEFDNVTGVSQAPSGPNYSGCFTSQPNPVWYFLSIDEPGVIELVIHQQNLNGIGIDVDFVMWGPFTNFHEGCDDVMNGVDPIQYSYSISDTETIGIGTQGGGALLDCDGTSIPPAAQTGEIYIIMITNWDGSPGYITLEPTNAGESGAGSTDCSLVCDIDAPELSAEDGPDADCDTVDVIIYANPADPSEDTVYYQGTTPGSPPSTNNEVVGSNGLHVTEPGTYYFRSYKEIENDIGETADCWSSEVAYTVQLPDINSMGIDAGEDQIIMCQGEVQIGFEPTPPIPDNYCTPQGINSSRYIRRFKTTNALENINNTNSGFSSGGYGDFTNMILKANAGNIVNFIVDIEGGTAGFRIWIDWGRDGQFNASDVVWNSSNYQNSHNGSFTIPADASGLYRIRIASHWLSSTGNVDPCFTSHQYGEFEDYILQVGESYDEATYSWSPSEGLSADNIPNPIASPEVTTTYTLTVNYGGCEITDEVTVTVYQCLPPLEICVDDLASLWEGLPSDVNPENVMWFEDDENEPGTLEVADPDEVTYGTYWAFYENQYWRLMVLPDFTQTCLQCPQIIWKITESQTANRIEFDPEEAEYGMLDFYKIDQGFKIWYNGTNIIGNFFYFKPANSPNVRFLDGALWGEDDLEEIKNLEGTPDNPLIRIVFGPNGVEGFYGSRVSADDPDYQLEPIELFGGAPNPTTFNAAISWYPEQGLTLKIDRLGNGSLEYQFKSFNFQEDCPDPPNEVFINPQIKQRTDHE